MHSLHFRAIPRDFYEKINAASANERTLLFDQYHDHIIAVTSFEHCFYAHMNFLRKHDLYPFHHYGTTEIQNYYLISPKWVRSDVTCIFNCVDLKQLEAQAYAELSENDCPKLLMDIIKDRLLPFFNQCAQNDYAIVFEYG